MTKNIAKKTLVILSIMIVGGLGGVVFDRYFFPYFSTTNLFKKYDFLKKTADDTTIINKTEQVYIKEETSINKISNQASSSVVDIISYSSSTASQKEAKSVVNKNSKNVNVPSVINGTGVIVTSDGLIMTYADAINLTNAKYKIIVYDGSQYDGNLVGVDYYSNLAFIKIEASNLPVISFGNSDDTKSGEKVIAVGNKLNSNANKYTAGIISSFDAEFNLFGKDISSSDKLEGVFDCDFMSDANFIGGPIVDYSGQVIGIVGARKQADGSATYFGIPSNKAKNVIDRAINKELEKDPKLGIYYAPLTQTFALANNLTVSQGALISTASSVGQQATAFVDGSNGQKAGLRLHDIITKVNDSEIGSNNNLSDLLYQFNSGDEINLSVLRDGQTININVQL